MQWEERRHAIAAGAVRVPRDRPLAAMDVLVGVTLLSSPALRFWAVGFVLLGVGLWIGRCTAAVRVGGPALCIALAFWYLTHAVSGNALLLTGFPPYCYLAYRHHLAAVVADCD